MSGTDTDIALDATVSAEPDLTEAASGRIPSDGLLRHLGTAIVFALLTIALLGVVYPLAITAVAQIAFARSANGSMVAFRGRTIGSEIIGERWTQAKYFQGRPSAAGKDGYDPTATGGTNFAPASKKFVDGVRDAIRMQKRLNTEATISVPMDLITASASGIDPDISPEGAYFQAPRIARARNVPVASVDALIARTIHGPDLGFLGEPHANVLELNLALERKWAPSAARVPRVARPAG